MKKILLAIAGVLALLLLVAALMPKDFKIEKEIVINKSQSQVFDYLKMIKNGNEWNPWMKKNPNTDPSGAQTFKGQDGAVGFINSWSSKNREIGVGEEEIIAIVPNEKIELELRLVEPIKATHKISFTTQTVAENQTKVTWTMTGSTPFPTNIIYFFTQKEVGKNFVTGLDDLKAVLEK